MSIIIACPSCGGKLRVSDELRGQMVRCPTCHHTFDSTEASAPPPPASEPRDLPLELAIEEPSSEPRPASSNDSPGLVEAVELKLSLDDEQPSPDRRDTYPTETPDRRDARPTAPPRLADEHDDDLKTCPACGKHLHRDSTRCYGCGERFDVRDRDRQSIRRKGPRRDCEPDRGATVLTLGVISLACLAISCAPIGLILGLTSWIMGQRDLRKIKSGAMDSNGQGMTQGGWICGIIGTILNGLLTLGCLGFIGMIWWQESNRPVYKPTPVPTRPVQQWPPPNQKPAVPK